MFDEGRGGIKLADLSDLIHLHHQGLYRYAFRLTGQSADAEDLVQETYLQANRKLHTIKNLGSLKPWLFSILRNQHLMRLRQRGKPVESLEDLGDWPAPSSGIEAEHDSELLQRLLLEMPEGYRTPLILFYLEDFTYRDISDQMGIPIGTVMSRLARAKDWIRTRYPVDDLPCQQSSREER